MRKREEVENDGKRVDLLQLEVLLDIRELLTTPTQKVSIPGKKKRGRPPKIKGE